MSPRRTVTFASVLLVAGLLGAQETAPITAETAERIREKLPDYDREAAEAARAAAAAPGPEEDVVVLPELTVIERQQQKMAEEDLYKRGLHDDQLVEKELSHLDRSILNRYHLPFVGMSRRERARQIYLERKNREFQENGKRLAENLALVDPEEAKKLRAAMNGWK
jgi:hypothetical protein